MMENKYRSLASLYRMMIEGYKEKDLNDQVSVGSYSTKAFEVSTPAQKLYSDLPKSTNVDEAEKCAIQLDKFFALYKSIMNKDSVSQTDLDEFKALKEKIMKHAEELDLKDKHESILKPLEKAIANKAVIKDQIQPGEEQHPADDPRFNSGSKEYKTDRKNDRDVDNIRKYLLSRNLKAQRKLKIIDDD